MNKPKLVTVFVVARDAAKSSRYNKFSNERVTFEDLDKPGTYYYLNLAKRPDSTGGTTYINYQNWDKNCKAGNILQVTLQTGKNSSNVNQFVPFKVLKRK